MSLLIYNGVQLGPYLVTQQVAFEPAYDPVSGMDYLYTQVTLAVSAVMAPPLAPALAGELPVDTMRRVNHLLLVPRRPLAFFVGNRALVSVPDIDARNGPMPQACNVRRIQGDQAFLVEFRVTAAVVDCGPESAGPAYLSHRYTESIDIDRFAMTRRTRDGTIITRSDLRVEPDALRGLVAAAIEPDFIRISSRYTISPDGLSLSYSFVDEEQYLMPPGPAGEADGEYFESTQEGAIRYGEVRLRLKGGKVTDKGALLARCLSVALAKLDLAEPQRDPKFGMLAQASIRERMYANEVEVHIRARLKQLRKRFGKINTDTDRFTKFPEGSAPGQQVPFDPGLRGTAQLAMIAAALQDPCLRKTVELRSGQIPNEPTLRGTTVPAQVSVTPLQTTDQSALRVEDDPGLYTRYQFKTRHTNDLHTFQIPLAAQGAKAAVLRTAAPTAKRAVEWTAEKMGSPPTVPDPTTRGGSNATLVKSEIDPGLVEVMPDGESIKYSVTGRYEYVYRDADAATLAAAQPPWMPAGLSQLTNNPFQFGAGIFNPNADDAAAPVLKTVGGSGSAPQVVTLRGGDKPRLENP